MTRKTNSSLKSLTTNDMETTHAEEVPTKKHFARPKLPIMDPSMLVKGKFRDGDKRCMTGWMLDIFLDSDHPFVDAYKIASYELTHDPLLREVGKRQRPTLLSTGASNLEEVRHATRRGDVAGGVQGCEHAPHAQPPARCDLSGKAAHSLGRAEHQLHADLSPSSLRHDPPERSDAQLLPG